MDSIWLVTARFRLGQNSALSTADSCPTRYPRAGARVTMLFHLFVLLHLLSGGDPACVRRLLSTHGDRNDQEGNKVKGIIYTVLNTLNKAERTQIF